MKKTCLAGAIALAFMLPQVHAASVSTETRTMVAGDEYNSSSTERKVDENGNVETKSSSYREKTPEGASSSSSTTVEHPDGSKASVEEQHSTKKSDGQTTTEEHSSTTTENQ